MASLDARASDTHEAEKRSKREELKKQLELSKNSDSLADGSDLKSM